MGGPAACKEKGSSERQTHTHTTQIHTPTQTYKQHTHINLAGFHRSCIFMYLAGSWMRDYTSRAVVKTTQNNKLITHQLHITVYTETTRCAQRYIRRLCTSGEESAKTVSHKKEDVWTQQSTWEIFILKTTAKDFYTIYMWLIQQPNALEAATLAVWTSFILKCVVYGTVDSRVCYKASQLVWYQSSRFCPFQTSGRICPKGPFQPVFHEGVYLKYLSQDESEFLTSKKKYACDS